MTVANKAVRQDAEARGLAPLNFTAALAEYGWREHLCWPVHPLDLRKVFQIMESALFRLWEEMPENAQRRALLLSFGSLLACMRPLVELTLVLDGADASGIALVGSIPEADYLQGRGDLPAPRDAFAINPSSKVRLQWFRRFARALSWTPWWRVPRLLIAPDAVAITHNQLLADAARDGRAVVAFRHANSILADVRRKFGKNLEAPADLVAKVTKTLVDAACSSSPRRVRLEKLAGHQISTILTMAYNDVHALESVPRLPKHVWSGTGGNYAARAVGIEVLRRGGRVRRFDHGGAAGLVRDGIGAAVRELIVSSTFVSAPSLVAASIRKSEAFANAARHRSIAIDALAAVKERAPHLRESARDSIVDNPPTVVYAPTIFRGFYQTAFGVIPDVVYLDWQLRVARQVQELPVNFLTKPHPEGLLKGRRHPLGDVAPISYERFEAVLPRADVFLFDRCQSTTFWIALCTDRPVVLLDFGFAEFESSVRDLLRERVRIVKVRYDKRNRPYVPTAELGEALLAGSRKIDSDIARRLLLADDGGLPAASA